MKELYFSHEAATAELIIWNEDRATLSAMYCWDRQKGYATELLKKICAYADENNLILFLTAAPYGHVRPRLGNIQLVEFYAKFDFVVKQQYTFDADMERHPK